MRAHLASCCSAPRQFALNGWKNDHSTCTHTGKNHKKENSSINNNNNKLTTNEANDEKKYTTRNKIQEAPKT